MSARRKATAAAYLGVMLKVLVIMVVAYALDGQKSATSHEPLFVVQDAFVTNTQDSLQDLSSENVLKPEVTKALISVVTSHDLNLDVTVFGQNMSSAIARAATVAQLLRNYGIPTTTLRVTGSWSNPSTSDGTGYDSIIAVKREI